jgi:hypothetical protein
MEKPKPTVLIVINSILLLCSIATVFSGYTIMLHYHMGHPGAISTSETFWGFYYSDWSLIHKSCAVAVTLFISYHTQLHWEWYKKVLYKKLMTKNRQVIVLSVIFAVALLTGFIPWILQLNSTPDITHRFLLEIHDKTGIVLSVFLGLHVSKRMKWFKNTYAKLKL